MAVRGLVRRQQHFLEAALLIPVDKHQLTFRVWQSAAAATRTRLENSLEEIREAGTWKSERIITSRQDVNITVEGRSEILNFCANNYLGLSSHPLVIQAGIDALKTHGAGLSSVRFICGTQDIHKDLEDKISRFHEREDTILYASCFDANAGLFEQLCGPEDVIISDELNHASIIDGIRLCKAKKFRYLHKNMKDLEEKLIQSQDGRSRLIVTDGVFSMDGNVCPLPEIKALAEKYNAMIFIDECHATGFFGKTGRGTEEFFGMKGSVDIINSTLGKALGGAAGGYTTASKPLIDLLRQRSRPYLFSNSLPPPVVACASQVFTMLLEDSSLVQSIINNTKRFRTAMTSAGFTISGDDHAICPVMLGDAKLASTFADMMLAEGIYVIGFSFPVVPKGKARIRVQISAAHTTEDIDRTVAAFVKVGKSLGVI
ncbi:2-amino-3-ketobutyrate coenzyme A ligase, mitochondrial [Eurytemora carolleeae]|uniref:2-amino-3-ketobutyrate coenzyme A ligase, mitochondrial n=1 Tax=Eurytemora carolleeae TaxID=1294199 RepID=UPI000C76EBA5|nr:2-amino-3-ketobutyrate coenzyme A ligase, mitochondrial [Eurytemora carolleeae]|eukprot:XP_023325028.1 2-amino-3-ketobutyrate coenzyme A ligase, mitochondrial-like [Eurytemora affinis]